MELSFGSLKIDGEAIRSFVVWTYIMTCGEVRGLHLRFLGNCIMGLAALSGSS